MARILNMQIFVIGYAIFAEKLRQEGTGSFLIYLDLAMFVLTPVPEQSSTTSIKSNVSIISRTPVEHKNSHTIKVITIIVE